MPSEFETYLRRYLNDNGTLWSSSQIERWASDGERELCKITPSVIARGVLPIAAGVPLYTFPTTTSPYHSLSISQITYKGKVLIALSQPTRRELFPELVLGTYTAAIIGGFSATGFDAGGFLVDVSSVQTTISGETGIPEFWSFSGESETMIQLYPTPSETLSAVDGANKWDSDISTKCIVEYRTFQITAEAQRPLYRLVRVMIKDYVLARAFELPGKGQQLQVAKYLNSRFLSKLEMYKTLTSGAFVANRNELTEMAQTSWTAQPNFGNIGRIVR